MLLFEVPYAEPKVDGEALVSTTRSGLTRAVNTCRCQPSFPCMSVDDECAIGGSHNQERASASVIIKEKLNLDFISAPQASPIATHDCIAVWLTDLRRNHESTSIPTLVIHGTDDLVL